MLLLTIVVFLLEYYMLLRTKGQFTLPTDGAFINCAVTQNLAFHKVWGLSRYAFQPAASSLLYPLILTPFFFIFGSHIIIPILVNWVAGCWLLLFLQKWMSRRSVSFSRQAFVLLSSIVVVPLPLLIISGLEFMLYILLAFLFITTFHEQIGNSRPLGQKLYLLAIFLVACRCEAILLVLWAMGLLFYRRRSVEAIKLFGAGFLPILFFGLICWWHKGTFFPWTMWKITDGALYWTTQGVAALTLILILKPIPAKTRIIPASRLLTAACLVFHIYSLNNETTNGIKIIAQQYQAARFIRLYYYWLPIGSDSIGIFSFFSQGKKLDLNNMDDPDLRLPLKGKKQTPVLLDSLFSKFWVARVIILNDEKKEVAVPKSYSRVASIRNLGDQSVPFPTSFFASDTSLGNTLQKNLRIYAWKFPKNLEIEYY